MQQQSQTSIWQPFIYLIMIGFAFIAIPKTDSSYLLARCVQGIELIVCIALFIRYFRQSFQISSFNWRVNLWWLIYTIITYAFVPAVGLTPFFNWLNIIIFLLFGVCYWQKDTINCYKYISIIFSLLIYLNAILLILYPDGLWIDYEWMGTGDNRRFLFGNYNQMGIICLLGITTQAMYTFATKHGKYNLILLILVSLGSVIFVGSMTSTIGLIILTTYTFIHRVIRHPKFFLIIFSVVYIAFFVLIIWIGNSIEEIDLLTRFIENVLSKNTTFTQRTDIWSNAVYKIQQSPWLGYGPQQIDWNIRYLNASGPHNLWLMLLLQGGIVLCGTFVYIASYVIKTALKATTHSCDLAVVAICVCFIMSLFEAYKLLPIFLLLQLAYYSPLLESNQIKT